MARGRHTSRRALLSAIAAGAIAGTGTAAAKRGPPHVQVVEKGIVVRIRDCKTAQVRGSERDFESVEVTAWEEGIVRPGQVDPSLWTTTDDLPADFELPGEPGEPGPAAIKEIRVNRFEGDDFTVTPREKWDCRGLVEAFAE